MEQHKSDWKANPSLEDILAVDEWSRHAVDAALSKASPEMLYGKQLVH
jgi:hypothetical protein